MNPSNSQEYYGAMAKGVLPHVCGVCGSFRDEPSRFNYLITDSTFVQPTTESQYRAGTPVLSSAHSPMKWMPHVLFPGIHEH
jgi:hypothetical protein